MSMEKAYSTSISCSINFIEKDTGSGSIHVLFGINSSATDAALGESFSSLRILPLSTMFLKASIAPIILVFPDAFAP